MRLVGSGTSPAVESIVSEADDHHCKIKIEHGNNYYTAIGYIALGMLFLLVFCTFQDAPNLVHIGGFNSISYRLV